LLPKITEPSIWNIHIMEGQADTIKPKNELILWIVTKIKPAMEASHWTVRFRRILYKKVIFRMKRFLPRPSVNGDKIFVWMMDMLLCFCDSFNSHNFMFKQLSTNTANNIVQKSTGQIRSLSNYCGKLTSSCCHKWYLKKHTIWTQHEN